MAALYVAPHLQTRLEPGLVGWRSHKDMWDFQADRLEYPDTAQRFEFGTIAYGADDEVTNLIARADAEMYRKKRAQPLVLRPWLHRAT